MKTEERIKDIIAEHLGFEDTAVKNTDNLFQDLGADSLDGVEILMVIEETFDLEISDEQAEECHTVQQIIDGVSGLIDA